MRAPLGLRSRLVLTFAFVTALTAVAVAGSSWLLVRDATLRRALDTAVRQARIHLEDAAATLPTEPTDAQVRAFLDDVDSRGAFDVVAETGSGTQATSISVSTTAVPDAVGQLVDRGRIAAMRMPVAGAPTVVVGGAVQPDGPRLTFFFPLDDVAADLALLARVLAGTSAALVVVSALIGAGAAAGVLRPIRRTRAAVREVAAGALDTRLPEHGGDELAELARSFNQMTEALGRTIDQLRELEAGQRRFVSDVSHELRTPLTALTTATDVLDANTDGLTDAGRRAARLITVETRRLTALVEDLMEISRMDAGAADVTLESVDVAANVAGALHARGWTDEVALRVEGTASALVDPRRLDTIVGNLVGNARDHGGPPITVTVRPEAGDVLVLVSDGGEGIPPQHLPRVFDRFYKADRARSRRGSGLGLAIARENARLHGGDITVSSRAGHGATFTLRLPRRRGDDDATEPTDVPVRGRR